MSPVIPKESCNKLNGNQKIWRFMNLYKFIDLIQKKALYFCQATKMAKEFDAHEGRYQKEVVNEILAKFKASTNSYHQIESNIKYPVPTGDGSDFFKISIESLDYTYVNCWHINNVEFDFMWKIYTERDLGIAIQTTYEKLCKSLNFHDYEIYIAPVDYAPKLEFLYLWESILIKREHFKPEQELRVWTCGCEKEPGFHVEVDLDILIDNIYVKPKTTEEERECVQKLLCDYKINKKVLPSTIDIEPEDYKE